MYNYWQLFLCAVFAWIAAVCFIVSILIHWHSVLKSDELSLSFLENISQHRKSATEKRLKALRSFCSVKGNRHILRTECNNFSKKKTDSDELFVLWKVLNMSRCDDEFTTWRTKSQSAVTEEYFRATSSVLVMIIEMRTIFASDKTRKGTPRSQYVRDDHLSANAFGDDNYGRKPLWPWPLTRIHFILKLR